LLFAITVTYYYSEQNSRCVAQLANCSLLHVYSRTTAAPSCVSTNKTSYNLFNEQA